MMKNEINKLYKPGLRFDDFTDPWKLYKWSDLKTEFYRGQTPSRIIAENWNGTINWLKSGELNQGIITNTACKITEQGLKEKHLHLMPPGTFVLAITGIDTKDAQGKCGTLGIETAINQSCTAVLPDQKLLTAKFLFNWYQKEAGRIANKYSEGTTVMSLPTKALKNLTTGIPTIDEQRCISDFFRSLDQSINLHNQQLNDFQNLKAGLLQFLFSHDRLR